MPKNEHCHTEPSDADKEAALEIGMILGGPHLAQKSLPVDADAGTSERIHAPSQNALIHFDADGRLTSPLTGEKAFDSLLELLQELS